MEKQFITEKILSAVREEDEKKMLNCKQAFDLAVQLDVPIKTIGDICNENSVRICNCQLGCFV
jgi:hypothetical protein